MVRARDTQLRADRDPQSLCVRSLLPALLGAVGLGERILNQLMLELKEDFDDHPITRRVVGKVSVDDWKVLIQVLKEWGVLPRDVVVKYERLRKLRNNAVHYKVPSLDQSSEREALEAISLLRDIIENLFGPHGDRFYIPGTTGAFI